jgi:hypothetical protein
VRKTIISAILSAAALIPVAQAAPAHAEPVKTRHCVSTSEYEHVWNMPGPQSYRITREHLERRWEVANAQRRFSDWDDNRSIFVLYPLCGYPNYSDGFAGAWWDRKTGLLDGVIMGTGSYEGIDFRHARKTF